MLTSATRLAFVLWIFQLLGDVGLCQVHAIITLDENGNVGSLADRRSATTLLARTSVEVATVKLDQHGVEYEGERLAFAMLGETLKNYQTLAEAAEVEHAFVALVAAPGTPRNLLDKTIKIMEGVPGLKLVFGAKLASDLKARLEVRDFLESSIGRHAFKHWKNGRTLQGLEAAVRQTKAISILSLRSEIDPDTDGEMFHAHPVLGRLKVEDPTHVAQLKESIVETAAADDGLSVLCFLPRHGLVLHQPEGPPIEFLVCFQCRQARASGLVKELESALGWFDANLRTRLNELLDARKIPREEPRRPK